MPSDLDLLYNTDETGLFYRLLPDRTLASRRDESQCKGFKASKDRSDRMAALVRAVGLLW
jgi:hypothetical protein